MTLEDRRLELGEDRTDPDLEKHEKSYLIFTRIVEYCVFAAPVFIALLFYWID